MKKPRCHLSLLCHDPPCSLPRRVALDPSRTACFPGRIFSSAHATTATYPSSHHPTRHILHPSRCRSTWSRTPVGPFHPNTSSHDSLEPVGAFVFAISLCVFIDRSRFCIQRVLQSLLTSCSKSRILMRGFEWATMSYTRSRCSSVSARGRPGRGFEAKSVVPGGYVFTVCRIVDSGMCGYLRWIRDADQLSDESSTIRARH